MNLTHSDLAEIIKTLENSTFDELVIEVAGVKVAARKHSAVGASSAFAATAAPPAAQPLPQPVSSPSPASSQSDAPSPASASEQLSLSPRQIAVRSPMVGTFFRRPAPTEQPFVELGSQVKEGEPLCLVEVMKLYTTIFAPVAGTIAAIGAEEAELVEYDQVLFAIDPN